VIFGFHALRIMTHNLLIRPAIPADKAPVLAFCAATWADGDYIEEVWNGWLAHPHSDLLVGLLDDRPVGLVHVMVEEGSGWLEGLRVAPHVRGLGLSHQMLRGGIAAARARGAEVLRLLTERSNTAMANILPQHGFERCFVAAWYSAPANDGPALQTVEQDEAAAAQATLETSLLLRETGGLYADGWSFVPFTPTRFNLHLARGEVVQVPDAGYAVVMPDGESDQPAIALAAGDVERMLAALRAHSSARTHGNIRIFLPTDGPLAKIAQAADYQPRPHRFGVWTLGL
jgi:ribosomal protein S18 acetylase RimI-like enzyme